MEGILILIALLMVVIILGLLFWSTWAWSKIGDLDSKNRDLGDRLSAVVLNEKGLAGQLDAVQTNWDGERKAWEGERKAWEGERKQWEREMGTMEAERKGWGEEKKKLEAAASECAAVKADYEGRLRGFSRVMSRKVEKDVGKVEKSVWKYAHLFEDGLGDLCSISGEESGSLDGSRCSSGSLAKGDGRTFVDLKKIADTARVQAEEAEKELEKAEARAKEQAEEAEKKIDELSEELEKAEGRVRELSEELEKAEAAKDAAEKRVETFEQSIKGWEAMWRWKAEECSVYEATVCALERALFPVEKVCELGEKIKQRE
eukprot:3937728-Rhodomonas_salina.1